MQTTTSNQVTLEVTIVREKDDLVWTVVNVGAQDVWAFLLVPTIVDGAFRVGAEAAWIDEEDEGTLLVRKVDTPDAQRVVPETAPPATDDPVRTGALLIKPRERREGRLTLGDEVATRLPYRPSGRVVKVRRVVMEVGWVPYREEAKRQMREWQGQPYAYLFTRSEPGGQRFARSAPLDWAR